MAESILFNIVEKILIKLASPAIENLRYAWDIKAELQKLENTLSIIKDVLQQKTLSQEVKSWLQQLEEVVGDADVLLDQMSTECLRQSIDKKHGKIQKSVSNSSSSSSSPSLPIVFSFKMGRKLKSIRNDLDQIASDWSKFRTGELIPTRNPNDHIELVREQTHSYAKASEIVGREKDKNSVVGLILNSQLIGNHVSVLPIVGLGGLGKTTLVKMVYNDGVIASNFDLKMWVYVSEDFSVKQIIANIIRSATGERYDHLDMDQIQRHLRNVLAYKRYLLVLDDVWNDDRNKWSELINLLVNCNCSSGSQIIVTTRSLKVAEITATGTVPAYYLRGLSEVDCLSLFLKCAVGSGNLHPNLARIGTDIVKKCHGVPLAIKTLGNLLYRKTDVQLWQQIKDNEIWQIEQKGNDILPILRLSYDQMPPSLRQCFTYCSIFPRGIEIPREEFINLWTAQGFIDGEDIGNQYFNELMSKFCFQDVVEAFDGDIITCKIHNLVQDLAQSMAGEKCSSIKINSIKPISEGTRHVLFHGEDSQGKQVPENLLKPRKLQTFKCYVKFGPIDRSFVKTVALSLNCLRVLYLNYLQIEELPNSIGKLELLRYLNLDNSPNLKSLPKSICSLVNLQTLSLINCDNLKCLPEEDITKLVNLRTLYLTSLQHNLPLENILSLDSLRILLLYNCPRLSSMLPSRKIQEFSNLRVLRIYNCPRLSVLPSMKYLSKLEKLWIWNCEELDLSLGTDHVIMNGLTSLRSLMLIGLPKLVSLPEGLRGNIGSNLQYLLIADCQNLRNLPHWINGFTSLVRLCIEHCPNLQSLPLGIDQLSAKLSISGCPLLDGVNV